MGYKLFDTKEQEDRFLEMIREGSAMNTPRAVDDPGYRPSCRSITQESGPTVYRAQHPYVSGTIIHKVR